MVIREDAFTTMSLSVDYKQTDPKRANLMRGAFLSVLPYLGSRLAVLIPPASVLALFQSLPALAQGTGLDENIVNPTNVTAASITLGGVFFGLLASLLLLREKRHAAAALQEAQDEVTALRGQFGRVEALLAATGDVSLVWQRRGLESRPTLIGDLSLLDGAPTTKNRFLDFNSWCPEHVASRLEDAITNLRQNGENFAITCVPNHGGLFEAVGRPAAGQFVVRFHNVSEERLAFLEMEEAHNDLAAQVEAFKSLLNAFPHPAWLHDESGRLRFANTEFSKLSGANPDIKSELENLVPFKETDWSELLAARNQKQQFSSRFERSFKNKTCLFEVIDHFAGHMFAGIAFDVTNRIDLQNELQAAIKGHSQTLDQLPTPVAIFGSDQRLRYHNAAYRDLFGLDGSFLAMQPEDGAILDRLRAERKLPEQANFRDWRADVLETYTGRTPRELWWYLPNGNTLRIKADRHPSGGLTYIYENVTDRIDLESRVKSLSKVQRETLDSLTEGVAVFGADGRLRLSNPAFRTIWPLSNWTEEGTPHVRDVIAECRLRHDDRALWDGLLALATDFSEHREPLAGRVTRKDDVTLDYAIVPLPDGSVMVTFDNVTDKIAVEQMLTERNRALETADELKSAFIKLVSYELREPLTTIIGFAEMLTNGASGSLNERQTDYAEHIAGQSRILHVLIDNILDLATIDAGILELTITNVDANLVLDQAITVVSDRISAKGISLYKNIPQSLGTFEADEKRVSQILFNLLVHGIDRAPESGELHITALSAPEQFSVSVRDNGPAIAESQLARVFDRFVTEKPGTEQKGAGLGLALVKSFVELHDGRIEIESREGEGTTITCTFPKMATKAISAA